MGLLSRLLEQRSSARYPPQWLLEAVRGGVDTSAGISVSPSTSLQSTAVFACVRILAESVASLPLILYERLERGKQRATGHPLYFILHDLPNPEMTSMEFREVLMGHLALWGNAYCEIVADGSGRVLELWPLRPDRMQVLRENGNLIYKYSLPSGGTVLLRNDQVMHIRAFGTDGVLGLSPIALARQAVGLSLATEEFGARFFGNGARPGIVLQHPGRLSEEAVRRLRMSWEDRHQGLSNAHRIAILEEGMSVAQVGIPPEDAQFLETRRFQVTEIARIFRVPPHMLADLERATFSNIEHQSIEFVTHTVRPWLVRWEQAINRDLILPRERGRYFAEFLVDGLLRGDIESRYRAYSIARQNGWLSANDIRELENMNPIDGGGVYLIPMNMVPAGGDGTPVAPAPAQQQEEGNRALHGDVETRAQNVAAERRRLAEAMLPVLQDVAARIVRREAADVGRMAQKLLTRDPAAFLFWLDDFYREHRDFINSAMRPVAISYIAQIVDAVRREVAQQPNEQDVLAFLDEYLEILGLRYVGESSGVIKKILREETEKPPEEAVQELLDGWKEKRPAATAREEAYRMNNAFSRIAYASAGILRLRWVATGESCPYCRNLNGKIVGVQAFFLPGGTDFLPEGAERPINLRSPVRHPPLHDGCDCMIVAGV
jgi:HK97 family phage portal protein